MDGTFKHAWRWPPAGDPAATERLVQRLAGDPLLAVPGASGLLQCLGEHSPFLSDLVVREATATAAVLRDGPDAVVAAALARLRRLDPAQPQDQIARALREAKRRVALAVAVADLAAIWTLLQVTAALSELAEAALQVSVRHLLLAAHRAGDLLLPNQDPDAGGFVVLAMGKLGARELNYSSDIDLVLIHDPNAAATLKRSPSAVFTRIARNVVSLLQARDGDGYVFRVDLRLRPDPAASPLSVALPTAIAYYESLAQNWERAAMIKARPVAGDLTVGAAFLDAIRPFVWRRSLDFSAIADLHAMKQRIDAHKKSGHGLALAGHDVKLGRGGIREIEFVAQTLQLVWGGRDPNLRLTQTVPVLRRLARAGHIGARAAGELIAAYRFLRRVEHRLQMIDDRQTHRLPQQPALQSFARFMAFETSDGFEAVALRHLRRVAARYADVFIGVSGTSDPFDAGRLAGMGFADPAAVLTRLAAWGQGEARALRSERARALMGGLVPDLLAALARQPQPDVAFARFDRLLTRLPAGVSLLSLFDRNRALLGRLAGVLGAAAPLAEHLASTPSALEGLLTPIAAGEPAALLAARLIDARALEDTIRIVQRTVREEDFSISLATLEGRIDVDAAGLLRTALADAAIAALLPRVLDDVTRRYGTVPGGELAVVLLGKAGGREMLPASDLDLMVIYDHPADVMTSVTTQGAARPQAASQWFVRAVHGLVAALGAPDAAGALYATDMRLRPSGNKGPVAVSLAAFRRYHRAGGEAWTWERMALTRARVVAGAPRLGVAVEAAISAAIAAAGPAAAIRTDAVAMRTRMARDAPPPGPPYALIASKVRPGGLFDVEFVAQTGLLTSRLLESRESRPQATREVLAALRDATALAPDDATRLIHADYVWRTVAGMVRLVMGRNPADPGGAAAEALLRAARRAGLDPVDVPGLHASLDALADEVRALFTRLVGAVGDAR